MALPVLGVIAVGFGLERAGFQLASTALIVTFYVVFCVLVASNHIGVRGGRPAVVVVLLVGIAMVLANFASYYVRLSAADSEAFTKAEHMTFADGLYVALGNFVTAGSGEVSPHTEDARIAVSIQYIVTIVLASSTIPAIFRSRN